jgi:osmoprotectant transport system permease protein
VSEQLALLPGYLMAHLRLSLVALAAGTALSVPLGILVTRRRRLEGPLLGTASVIQTIPSLALLAIMVPLLGVVGAFTAARLGVELRSIGELPALLALTLYSMLPILRNTVAGIQGVDPALVEAAEGVGMTPSQRLVRVELPLAMPVIVAGLRTASVWVVGTATLSTPVGATSLGNFIFSGLQTRNHAAVLVGCVAAAGLALLLDQLIRVVELGLRERRRAALAFGLVGLLALSGLTAAGFALDRRAGEEPLRIGAKTFTEQYVLAELLAGYLERETGQRAVTLQSLGSTVLFEALRQSEIDLYVDYTGTLFATVLRRSGPPPGRARVLREVKAHLAEVHGVSVPCALGFENTYALGMRGEHARALGVETIGDLARVAPRLEMGADYEFFQRPEWAALAAAYELDFRARRSMDPALMYQALAAGEVDVISAFSTDGRIAAYGIRLLRDERGVIPPYDAVVLASPRLARERPAVLEALRRLEGVLDEIEMQRMNLSVDRGGESPARVAREFLSGLVPAP